MKPRKFTIVVPPVKPRGHMPPPTKVIPAISGKGSYNRADLKKQDFRLGK